MPAAAGSSFKQLVLRLAGARWAAGGPTRSASKSESDSDAWNYLELALPTIALPKYIANSPWTQSTF